MRIGIDLDGVVYNSEQFYRAQAEIFDIERGGKGAIKPKSPRVQERFMWDKAAFDQFLSRYLIPTTKTASLKPLAREVMQMLKNDGHSLIAISSRGTLDKREITISKKCARAEKLPFDDMIFCTEDKAAAAKEQKIDVFIEDYIDNATKIAATGIKCIYFRDLPSQPATKTMTEVENWGEIYRYFVNQSQLATKSRNKK